jgi:uncharacterized protein YggT (Ycf19 family)
MGLIDFITNVACLLLWLNWRFQPRDTTRLAPPATLAGTLWRADKPRLRGWQFPLVLVLILLLRAVLYRVIGPAVTWSGSLDAGVVSVSMRSDNFWRMLFFSILSFGFIVILFQLWMVFLSMVQPRTAGAGLFQPLIQDNLGRVDLFPTITKALLPLLGVAMLWWLVSWPLTAWGIFPRPVSSAHRFEQALVVGLGSYLVWKYLIGLILVLHLLNSYIYFGRHPVWAYVDAVAKVILSPLRKLPLRAGRVDFSPIAMLALVFFLASLAEGGRMIWCFGWHRVPGLLELYQRLPL